MLNDQVLETILKPNENLAKVELPPNSAKDRKNNIETEF